jgi:hypothetical protein
MAKSIGRDYPLSPTPMPAKDTTGYNSFKESDMYPKTSTLPASSKKSFEDARDARKKMQDQKTKATSDISNVVKNIKSKTVNK